ncbi:MAG: hypothetical protein Q4F82_10720 [bacterium]|nr:hypothetical protein [bacterium]
MTTLSVTIDDTNKLQMLLDWLSSISFVKKVEVNESSTGNFDEVMKVLEQIPEGGILKEISDPVEWQKQQRDEWGIDLEQF